MTLDQQLNGNHNRRMANEARYLNNQDKMDRRRDYAETRIGELMRNGEKVLYVFPKGGKYREGTRRELIDFLIRNDYA